MTLQRFPRAALTALAVLASPVPAVAQEDPPSLPPELRIETAGWVGGIRAEDQAPPYCVVARQFDSTVLQFAMNLQGQLGLVMQNESWQLTPEQTEEVQLRIDDVLDTPAQGQAIGTQEFLLPLGNQPELLELLRRGSRATVNGSFGEVGFPLSGTFASLGALQECVATTRQLVAERVRQNFEQSMTTEGLRGILQAAGFENFEIWPESEVPEDGLSLDYAWSVGDLTGGLHRVPRGQPVQIDEFMDAYLDRFEERCRGDYTEEVGETEVIQDVYAIKTAEMQCEAGGETSHVALVATLDDIAYSMFFHEGAAQDADRVEEQTRKIAALVGELASQSAEPAQVPAQGGHGTGGPENPEAAAGEAEPGQD